MLLNCMFLLAVLCITKEKKVLFAWAIDPSAVSDLIRIICY